MANTVVEYLILKKKKKNTKKDYLYLKNELREQSTQNLGMISPALKPETASELRANVWTVRKSS